MTHGKADSFIPVQQAVAGRQGPNRRRTVLAQIAHDAAVARSEQVVPWLPPDAAHALTRMQESESPLVQARRYAAATTLAHALGSTGIVDSCAECLPDVTRTVDALVGPHIAEGTLLENLPEISAAVAGLLSCQGHELTPELATMHEVPTWQ